MKNDEDDKNEGKDEWKNVKAKQVNELRNIQLCFKYQSLRNSNDGDDEDDQE